MQKFFVKRRTSGFTLIELLVVIAIIGVLASIVLASLNQARQKSRDARRIADVKQIQLALELSYDGASPPAYPVATASCSAAGVTPVLSRGLEVLVTSNYIPVLPRDPQNASTCYQYATNTSGTVNTTYHLGATLEQSNNPALGSDKDCNSSPATAVGCPQTAYVGGFDGTAVTTYDVVP